MRTPPTSPPLPSLTGAEAEMSEAISDAGCCPNRGLASEKVSAVTRHFSLALGCPWEARLLLRSPLSLSCHNKSGPRVPHHCTGSEVRGSWALCNPDKADLGHASLPSALTLFLWPKKEGQSHRRLESYGPHTRLGLQTAAKVGGQHTVPDLILVGGALHSTLHSISTLPAPPPSR